MYYTYILISEKNGDMYVGSTADVARRFNQHNAGKSPSTKPYRPWVLMETRAFPSRSEAVREERFLKNHQQKEILKRKYSSN